MLRLSNIKVLPKLVAVIALISAIVGTCVWYAQSRMTTIDDGYSRFIVNEAAAVAESRQLNRLVVELNYWVYRIIAETEQGQMQGANTGFEAAVPKVRELLTTFRAHAPSFADRIDGQAARIERYLRDVSDVRRLGTGNQNDQALALAIRRSTRSSPVCSPTETRSRTTSWPTWSGGPAI